MIQVGERAGDGAHAQVFLHSVTWRADETPVSWMQWTRKEVADEHVDVDLGSCKKGLWLLRGCMMAC